MSVTPIPPPTKKEKRMLDKIAGSTAKHVFTLQLLRRINDDCGSKFTDLNIALPYLTSASLQLAHEVEDNIRLRKELEENKTIMAELECMVDLATINHSGLQQTLALWKSWSVEERMHYERISHDCPVEEHPEIFIDANGYIRLTNGRFA